MSSTVKHSGRYSVCMTIGYSYYAYVNDKSAEWHCFDIRTPGTYKITCNGVDDYTIVEEDPPKENDKS